MSLFTDTPLVVQPLSEWKRVRGLKPKRSEAKTWILHLPLVYEVGELGSGDYVSVPLGFVTDLASTPRLIWSFIPPFGLHAAAAVLHDYGYGIKDRSRKEYDRIFRDAMLVLGVRTGKAYIMWLAVRIFGWLSWLTKDSVEIMGEKSLALHREA